MSNIVWAPQAGPQAALVNCPIKEIMFGGARGGGKTDGMLGKNAIKAEVWGEHQKAIFFRRTLKQLEDAIARAHQIYGINGLEWKWQEQKGTYTSPKGATLKFRYLDKDIDAQEYQGHNYTDVYFEELTNFPTPNPYNLLRGTLRSAHGVPTQLHATCNPGGAGHNWVKERFVSPNPAGYEVLSETLPNGRIHKRVFIPSKLSDNKIMNEVDPDYENNLYLSGSESLVRAWLNGDWDIIEGAFFDRWSDKMSIKPFTVPDHWTRFRSFDWGSAAPFSVGWWTVASDDYLHYGSIIPRGALVRYRELYGAKAPNVGLKLDVGEVRDMIISRETAGERFAYSVADPAIFSQDGGPSLAERMLPTSGQKGIAWIPADNKRVAAIGKAGGWDVMRARIKGIEDDEGVLTPMIYFFDTCVDSKRTIPVLQHDTLNAEDLDCWIAGTMVSTPNGEVPIEGVVAGDVVCTPIGNKKVTHSYVSGAGQVCKVTLSNGKELIGTPDHKIMVKGSGLVELKNLECLSILEERNTLWESYLLHTMALFTQSMKEDITTIPMGLISRMGMPHYIDKFGLMLTEIYHKAITSTILTTIKTTTTYQTCNVLKQEHTKDSTDIYRKMKYKQSSRNGVKVMKGRLLLEKTRLKCEKERQSVNLRASIVRSLLLLSRLQQYTAAKTAPIIPILERLKNHVQSVKKHFGLKNIAIKKLKPVRVVAVGFLEEAANVYNLTVKDSHLFYANGIVSSNTRAEDHIADEWRYACMSRPWEAKLHQTNNRQDHWARKFADKDRSQNSWKTL